ncbi:MAG: ABC transporter substrate-binding protein [Promethearchaeota archaeon]
MTLYYDTDIGARAFCDSLRPAMNQTGILVKLVSADIFANPDSDNWNVITGGTSPYFVGVDPLLRFTTTDPVWEVDNPWYILIPDYTKYIPSSIYEDYIYQIRHSPDFDTVLRAVYEAQKILAYEVPALPILRFFDTSLYRTDHFKGWVNPINTYLASPWSWLNVRLHSGVPGGVFNQSYISYFDLYSLNPLNYSQMCFSPIFGISRSQLQWWSPLSLIYDTLWVQDPNTALPIPWLADAWDITVVNNASLSEEVDPLNPPEGVVPALKITFTLNPDFKWHDGQPVTPEDVKFSYQLFENTNESYFYGFTKAGGGYIDPARMTTDNEAGNVTFIVESTGYFDFYDTCLPILPKHIWESISDPLSYSNDHPIGSGPYKFKSHDFGFNLILERNLNWPFVPENSTTLDFDGDGLVNGYEKELGTDIWKSDTDGDGDLDGDEIGQWLLDPLNPLLNSNTRMAIVLIPVAVFLGAIGGGLIYLRRDEVKRWLVKKAGREAPDKKDIEDYASQVQELVGAHEELEEE